MIYTYEDVVKKANDTGLSGQFSKSDWDAAQKSPDYGISLLQLMQDASGADSEEKRMLANHAVNALRKSFGTTAAGGGAAAGKVNELLGKVDSYGSFGYSKETQYQKLLQEALNPEKFSYDPEKDASWSALEKAYRREGSRATQDTMAKAAIATGGVPSSYAITAAQQAGNHYAAQLADRMPEMEQNAYQKYLNDIAQKLNLVGVMQSDRQQEQTDWQNGFSLLQSQLGNWQKQADTEYGQGLDAANMAYKILQDQIAKEQQEKENTWRQEEMDRTADQKKVNNAMAMMQTLGYATPEIAAVLGIPVGTKVDDGGQAAQLELENGWKQQQLDSAAAQQEVNNAMALMQILGYATPEIAQVLGVPAGTKIDNGGLVAGGNETANKLLAMGVGASDAGYIAGRYPDGVIADAETWNILLESATEAELNAAGFQYKGEENELDYASAVALLGAKLGNNPKKVADAIEKGYLETYYEGNLIKVRKGPKWNQWSPEEEQNKMAAGGPKFNIV